MCSLITSKLWNQQLQDVGKTKEELPKKAYCGSKITPIGPKDSKKILPRFLRNSCGSMQADDITAGIFTV